MYKALSLVLSMHKKIVPALNTYRDVSLVPKKYHIRTIYLVLILYKELHVIRGWFAAYRRMCV